MGRAAAGRLAFGCSGAGPTVQAGPGDTAHRSVEDPRRTGALTGQVKLSGRRSLASCWMLKESVPRTVPLCLSASLLAGSYPSCPVMSVEIYLSWQGFSWPDVRDSDDTAVCDTEIAAGVLGPHRYPSAMPGQKTLHLGQDGPGRPWQTHPGPESTQIPPVTPFYSRVRAADQVLPPSRSKRSLLARPAT
ncbi:hypothetical protein EYF80_002499 [Liparis tanakae]|uniref:Uncharacterized protein n=1 Tax=Liparis tanakae TaxID=230148 RepID=A0A4Z2JBC4_9TELE|nr:hypothetical protein EYF80_002499 [Liparis tanakae]